MTTMRYSMRLTGLLLAVALMWGCAGGAGEDEGKVMPVVLITVDGLFAEQLSAFGGSHATPALDSLAGNGVVYRDSWTACPMSRPAVATYLTGLSPDRHGVRDELFIELPGTVPTIATELAARGYRTAAFPNSSLLGRASGLLRGFETVDDPPLLPIGPQKILPLARPSREIAEHFKLWLGEQPPSTAYFAWLHFSAPLLEQLEAATPGQLELGKRGPAIAERREERSKAKGKATVTEWRKDKGTAAPAAKGAQQEEPARPPAIESFDAAVAEILAALADRGESEIALVIVAPTMGDIGGGAAEPIGPGFSLDERAIRVPVIVRFPEGGERPRDERSAVWAPDVPATIAQLAGLTLHGDAEGLSLLEEADEERILFSFSWATLDQMGWPALRAARTKGLKLTEGFEDAFVMLDGSGQPDREEDEARLRQALLERAEPPAFAVDMEEVRQWLAERGVEPRPISVSGRLFGPAEKRRQTTDYLWRARLTFQEQHAWRSLNLYRHILELDPDGRAAHMEQGQVLALARSEDSLTVLREAAKRYPTDPEALHWFAHAVWADSFEAAEPLLDTLLNYMPHDGDVLYDKACARSLAGDLDESVKYLEAAINAGFVRWNIIEADGDLRALRESPKFSELLRKYNR